MRARRFSMKLPSLRERSNETSVDLHNERIDIQAWKGSWPEYLEYLVDFQKSQKAHPRSNIPTRTQVLTPDEYAKLPRPSNGNLDISMFPVTESTQPLKDSRNASGSSSNYNASPPTSTDGHVARSPPTNNTMHLSDLHKYSRANDRLSNLRSSSRSADSGGNSVIGAAEDAAVAALGWESMLGDTGPHELPAQPVPNHQHESQISDSGLLCSSQQAKFDNIREREAPRRLSARRLPFVGSISQAIPVSDTSPSQDIPQFDGPSERKNEHQSRDASENPDTSLKGTNKRKASQFSLRSLSDTFSAKRPRLNIRKLATTVGQSLSQARRTLKQRNLNDRRNFEA